MLNPSQISQKCFTIWLDSNGVILANRVGVPPCLANPFSVSFDTNFFIGACRSGLVLAFIRNCEVPLVMRRKGLFSRGVILMSVPRKCALSSLACVILVLSRFRFNFSSWNKN